MKKIIPAAKKIRQMTSKRLQNIALHYLGRFDSSTDNLRQVLKRRVFDYARKNPDFDVAEAEQWIENIVEKMVLIGYINDNRYAEFKIDGYLNAGKPVRYIRQKMMQKGIGENIVDEVLQNCEFDEKEMALRFAQKKKIGPWRTDEENRRLYRQKDLATLVRAGFGYDVAQQILGIEMLDDFL